MEYFAAQDKVVSSTEYGLKMDCIVDREEIQPVYANLIAIAVLPIALLTVLLILRTIKFMAVKRLTWKHCIERFEGNSIVLMFFIHPTILKITL